MSFPKTTHEANLPKPTRPVIPSPKTKQISQRTGRPRRSRSVSVAKDKKDTAGEGPFVLKYPKNGNVPEDTIDLNESLNELKDMYESVFKIGDELKTMKGRPMRIDLVENVLIKPLDVNTP